jgi:hypothetical protein
MFNKHSEHFFCTEKMIAPQNHEKSIGQILNSTISCFYDELDQIVHSVSALPGHYKPINAPSYQSSGEIPEFGRTRVDIATTNFGVITLDNSFILMEQTIPIHIPQLHADDYVKEYYVGYLCSIAAIRQYWMYSETEPAFIQSDMAHFEWIYLYNSYSDEAKENDENFATVKKIRERNPLVPGQYINVAEMTKEIMRVINGIMRSTKGKLRTMNGRMRMNKGRIRMN